MHPTSTPVPRRRAGAIGAVTLALLGLAFGGCGREAPHGPPLPSYRIALDTAAFSRLPGPEDAPDERLEAGQEVELLEAAGPWNIVRLPDGRVVWVPMAAVAPAPAPSGS